MAIVIHYGYRKSKRSLQVQPMASFNSQGSRSLEQLLLYVVRIFELARCAGCAGEERASCWASLAVSEAY